MGRTLGLLTAVTLALWLSWMAPWIGRGGGASLAFAQNPGKAEARRTILIDRKPARHWVGQDPYSNFNGVALDEERGEVFISNDNTVTGESIEVFHTVFMPTDRITEPLRRISGPKADLGSICSLAVSPEFKEIFKVNSDGNGEMGVYPLDANGDVEPIRWVPTSHGAWGVFLERKFDELFVTIEHVNRIAVYGRTAQLTDDDPVRRYIQGPKTQLADPHGIFVDVEKNEIYVANHGHWHYTEPGESFLQEGSVPPELKGKRSSYSDVIRPLLPSTGKFLPPSIAVYSRMASGDVAPLRVIQGSMTRLNLPLGLFVDTVSHQIVVANGGDDSVLFFDANATGDAAPVRVLKGPKSGVDGPTGVVIDKKRQELWVTNWTNHTATVYSRTADGDTAPLRTLRSAPKGTQAMGFGGAGVAYNPKRDEILAPN